MSKPFHFEPSDFANEGEENWQKPCVIRIADAAYRANAKLQEWLKDAKVVYGTEDRDFWCLTKSNVKGTTHKALLINIEPIEPCRHEASKVKCDTSQYGFANMKPAPLICECGARVKPSGFESVKE